MGGRYVPFWEKYIRAESVKVRKAYFRLARLELTGDGFGTSGVCNADESLDEDAVLVVIPISEDDGVLCIVSVCFYGTMEDEWGADTVGILTLRRKWVQCNERRVEDGPLNEREPSRFPIDRKCRWEYDNRGCNQVECRCRCDSLFSGSEWAMMGQGLTTG
jgi:hypothetical protein